MGKLIKMSDYRESQLNNEPSSFKAVKQVADVVSRIDNISGNDISDQRFATTNRILSEWMEQYKLNPQIRMKLNERIRLDDQGLLIGNVFWDFKHFYESALPNGMMELKKYKLEVPTVDDVEQCSMIMPGNTIEDKRSNLLKLLGFDINKNIRVWTADKSYNELDLIPILDITVNDFVRKVRKVFTERDFYHVLYYYKTGVLYYECDELEKGYICGIRRMS